MKLAVVGCGYLGAVHAACMASLGHEVVGYDIDAGKVEALNQAQPPFYEPGLPELIAQERSAGRLTFTSEPKDLQEASVYFVCVGTPQRVGELAADLSFVNAALAQVEPLLLPGDVIVGKSTVPVGTAAQAERRLLVAQPDAVLVWNPEFLREGHAVQDTLVPDRLVFGYGVGREIGRKTMQAIYGSVLAEGVPVVETDFATAELVKVAANSFLATKISFINAMAELCEAAGGDVVQLADAIGLDKRIGRSFLGAGLGFGGGCLPKDIRAFMARAGELGVDQALAFLREVDAINMRRRVRMVDLAREVCGGSVVGKRLAVLGLAFKPNSDDIRDSPALNVAAQLRLQGAEVVATDPKAVTNARHLWPDMVFAESVADAVRHADLVMLLTEWPEYLALRPGDLRPLVRHASILDGRNALSPTEWVEAGWTYRALGRHHSDLADQTMSPDSLR